MAGTKAQGARFWYSTDSGSTYNQIVGVTGVNKPVASKADIDMTDLDSTAMEYEQDIPDYGTVSIEVNFDGTDTHHQALLALETSGAQDDFLIEFPETGVSTMTTFDFLGFVQSVDVSASRGGKQDATITLRVDGAVTIGHGATAQT